MKKLLGYKKLRWITNEIEKILKCHKSSNEKIKAIREVFENVPEERTESDPE